MSDATITHSTGAINAPLSDYRAERAAGTVVHQIAGSENADYTLRPFELRVGSFTLVFPTPVAADVAASALCTAQVLTLASVARPGVNMSFIIPEGTAPELAPGAAGETVIRLSFQEVIP